MKKYALPVPIESSEVQLFVNTNLPFFCPSPGFAYGTTVATGGGTSVYAGSASVAAFAYGQSVSAAVFPETDGEYQ